MTSWVLFASSGPLSKAVMVAGWSPAAVTSARIALSAALLMPVVVLVRPSALRFRGATSHCCSATARSASPEYNCCFSLRWTGFRLEWRWSWSISRPPWSRCGYG
ncbi:hypothetical protein NS14008_16645 [Nocardia seriolae]|nr:hypothetical protein NS14008_16645 [Nocardia seriolae]